MQTPMDMLAEVAKPVASNLQGLKWIVAFDNVSDPGNFGTLLRSALALGWEGAFILKTGCDPFNDKALRSNMYTINPISKTIIPTLNDYWLSGFTDAEGCFSLSLLSNSSGYRLRFLLCQKWEANKPILDHICSLFGVGNVFKHSSPNNWEYIINGVKNCNSILPYFDKYVLFSKKKESYKLWKELRLQLIKGDHLNTNIRIKMKELANEINNVK